MHEALQIPRRLNRTHGIQQRALQDPRLQRLRPHPARRLRRIPESDGSTRGRVGQGGGADDGGD